MVQPGKHQLPSSHKQYGTPSLFYDKIRAKPQLITLPKPGGIAKELPPVSAGREIFVAVGLACWRVRARTLLRSQTDNSANANEEVVCLSKG